MKYLFSVLVFFITVSMPSLSWAEKIMVSPNGFQTQFGEDQDILNQGMALFLDEQSTNQYLKCSKELNLNLVHRNILKRIGAKVLASSDKKMRVRLVAIHLKKGTKQIIASKKFKNNLSASRFIRLKKRGRHIINTKKFIYVLEVEFLKGAPSNVPGDQLAFFGLKINSK